jgi:alpha-ketoglutarate-dependent taurine dioxygenase
MYVKLQNNFINLDLIKKVTEVKAYYVHQRNFEEGKKQSHREIDSLKEEADILYLITNGNEYHKKYVVAYGFEISYINEKYFEKVITGTNRHEAEKFLEAFIKYLNNNQLTIPEIKI